MGYFIHVDNSEFFRKQMKIYLSELGHETESFSRGDDAIKAVQAREVSCVITGLELSDMKGEELIRQLLASNDLLPIITVTGSKEEDRIKRINDLGVRAIVRKTGDWKETLNEILN